MKIVISLGGSVIVPNSVDYSFLKKFKNIIKKIKKGNKIVIVTGGGGTARKYIEPLRKEKINENKLSFIGFEITRVNGLFLGNFLGVKFAETLNEVKEYIKTNNVVVCGALSFKPKMTTDGTAAEIARAFKVDYFINVTNVKGLFNKNPKKFKDAKFIQEISFKDFSKIANRIKFKAGQHFVLDQSAAKLISRYKIKTVIIKDVNNLIKIVNNERFIGTTIV